jgi:hypothetical protein
MELAVLILAAALPLRQGGRISFSRALATLGQAAAG